VTAKRYLFGILVLDLAVLAAVFLLERFTKTAVIFSDAAVLALCFSVITISSLYVFTRGLKKETDSQTMHILVAVVIKMLLEMVLALIWFFVAKKTYTSSLLLFFVLYLSFSLFSIFYMLNTLKHKPL
jgi:hypothetical protein